MFSKQHFKLTVCYHGNKMQKYIFFALLHYMYEINLERTKYSIYFERYSHILLLPLHNHLDILLKKFEHNIFKYSM